MNPKRLSQSVGSAIPLSLLVAGFLVASETLHMTRRNPYFVADLGGALLQVIAWCALFALVVGVVIGTAIRGSRGQAFAVSAIGYVVISLKIFWVDATLLASPVIAAVFAVFTCGWFLSAASIGRRLSLPNLFPILLTVGYANVCLGIASGWALAGGRLLPFLLSARTIMIVLAGAFGVILATALHRSLGRRTAPWWRAVVPLGILLVLVACTGALAHSLPTSDRQRTVSTHSGGPDIYVVSFDALRTDMLKTFIASHPDSYLARISQQATAFENVVSHGLSTDVILANNTFAGSSSNDCRTSIPGELSARGYFTAMLFANLGKRPEGSVCYDYFFSGGDGALVNRYSVPALTSSLARSHSHNSKAISAVEIVEKLREIGDAPAPLYAYAHMLELHAPYLPAGKRNDDQFDAAMQEYMRRCYANPCDPSNPADAKLIGIARSAYVELIDEADQALGQVLELAKRRGRKFVVVVTADHGELFGEHGGFAHGGGFVGELFDIPFLVSNASRPKGQRCELMLSSEALRSTALSAADARPAEYPDREVLELSMPPLGQAWVDKRNASIRYELSDAVMAHAGTWRNIHRTTTGTLAYPIEHCE